jgi:hypothetical protein
MAPTRNRKKSKNSRVRRPSVAPLRQAGPEGSARTAENMAALKMVKSTKGPNNKYINGLYQAINLAPTLTAPGLFCLNAVGQGTSENTRIGRLAKMKWLDIDFVVEIAAAETGPTNLRVFIVVETTALGSAFAPTQFFVDNTNFTPNSQRDRTNRNASRYVVLYDSRTFSLGGLPYTSGLTAPATTGVLPSAKPFNLHLPLNFTTDYSRGNSGTITDIDTNSLYFVVLSDDGNANHSTCVGSFTLCFNDDS